MSDIAARIGRNIAHAREAAGISQRELGRRIGASSAIVPMWESGQCAPGAEFLLAVSEALHVPVQGLYGQQYADPETEQAVTWWAGYREGWRQCAENVRAATTLRPDRMPPRPRPQAPDDPIEAQLQHLRYGAPAPDLSGLPPAEREHEEKLLRLVTALADRYPESPPIEDDPVARRLGLTGDGAPPVELKPQAGETK